MSKCRRNAHIRKYDFVISLIHLLISAIHLVITIKDLLIS